jgi:hypothetical protein
MPDAKWHPVFTTWRNYTTETYNPEVRRNRRSNQEDHLPASKASEPEHTVQTQSQKPDGPLDSQRPSVFLDVKSCLMHFLFGSKNNAIESSADNQARTPLVSDQVPPLAEEQDVQHLANNTDDNSMPLLPLTRRSTNRRHSGVPVATPRRSPLHSKFSFLRLAPLSSVTTLSAEPDCETSP